MNIKSRGQAYCGSIKKGAHLWLSIPHNGDNFKTTCWIVGKHKWKCIFIHSVVCLAPFSYLLLSKFK